MARLGFFVAGWIGGRERGSAVAIEEKKGVSSGFSRSFLAPCGSSRSFLSILLAQQWQQTTKTNTVCGSSDLDSTMCVRAFYCTVRLHLMRAQGTACQMTGSGRRNENMKEKRRSRAMRRMTKPARMSNREQRELLVRSSCSFSAFPCLSLFLPIPCCRHCSERDLARVPIR